MQKFWKGREGLYSLPQDSGGGRTVQFLGYAA